MGRAHRELRCSPQVVLVSAPPPALPPSTLSPLLRNSQVILQILQRRHPDGETDGKLGADWCPSAAASRTIRDCNSEDAEDEIPVLPHVSRVTTTVAGLRGAIIHVAIVPNQTDRFFQVLWIFNARFYAQLHCKKIGFSSIKTLHFTFQ